MIKHLKDETQPHLMLEAAWFVANLCTGNEDQIKFFFLKNNFFFKKLTKFLGKKMIEMNYVGLLTARLNKQEKENIEIIRFTTWALSNLSRGKIFDKEREKLAIFAFLKVISYQKDLDILDEAIHALTDLVDEDDIKFMIDVNVPDRLLAISRNCSLSTLNSILEIINQISYGTDPDSAKSIINSGFVDRIYEILNDDVIPASMKRDCLWILSNLTVESSEVIERVLSTKERFEIIAKFCCHGNKDIMSEAIHALCNITNKGNLTQKQFLVDNGIFKMFYDNLKMDSGVKTILTVLEALEIF